MKLLPLLLTLMIGNHLTEQTGFRTAQEKFERVRTAYKEKEVWVNNQLKKQDIRFEDLNILIVAYKDEQLLEVYAKNKKDNKYKKVFTYDVCKHSGELGPKRKQGDYQVPEGFYHIDRFNPVSNYYLSLGLNYPNSSDKKKSTAQNLGGDIFIHGDCVSIGCLPITDSKIKEVYICAVQARQNGQQKIPVYLFPFRFSDSNWEKMKSAYELNQKLLDFWDNLKQGYDLFEKKKQELNFSVDNKGNYVFI